MAKETKNKFNKGKVGKEECRRYTLKTGAWVEIFLFPALKTRRKGMIRRFKAPGILPLAILLRRLGMAISWVKWLSDFSESPL